MWVTQSHTFSPSLLLLRLYHMSQLSLYFLYYLQLSDELSYSDNSIMSFKPVVSLICYFFSRCSTSHEKHWLWVQSGAFSERWRWTGQLVVQCSIRYLLVVSWVRLLDITGSVSDVYFSLLKRVNIHQISWRPVSFVMRYGCHYQGIDIKYYA